MATLPSRLQPLFWDTDLKRLDVQEYKVYVIERVLEFGDEDAYRWLFGTYTDEDIIAVVKSSRRISRRTAVMMANFYNIPEEEVRCLQNTSGRTLWPY